jgi:hypothetical protein
MGAALQRHTHRPFALEVAAQGRFRGRDAAALDHLTLLVEHAVLTEPVPKIETYGYGWLVHRLFQLSGGFDKLLHRLVSFCTSSACEQINLPARPAVSSHL